MGDNSREIIKCLRNVAAVNAVDILTDEEIDELRKLVSLDNKAASEYVDKQLQNDSKKGLYLQLTDLGFLNCVELNGGRVSYFGYEQKTNWAVRHHDHHAEERKRRQKKEQRFETRLLIIGGAIGLVASVATAFFERLFGVLL